MTGVKEINISLAGVPNCGKTTLFNSLTGLNMHTGNFPGVTVEKRRGKIKGLENAYLTDIPGIYALEAVSEDEKAAVNHIKGGLSDLMIVVCDGTGLKKSLCLALSVMALSKPVILAVNLMDEVKKRGGNIDFRLLTELLGVKAVPVSALRGEGVEELKKAIFDEIKNPVITSGYENMTFEQIRRKAEYITKRVYKTPKPDTISRKIDGILTGKHTALFCFMLIMAIGFYLVFGILGKYITVFMKNLIEGLSDSIYAFLSSVDAPEMLKGLICDGIMGGVLGVLAFLPVISLLFLFLSILEDTGYMARVAFVFDRIFVSAGLSGRGAIPMLLGFGCSVPAVMACRTMGFEKEKRQTVRLIPFMSCQAKIPVYLLFCSVFFPNHTSFVITVIYLSGIILAAVFAFVSNIFSKTKPVAFIMELPPYRFPTIKNTFWLMAQKSLEFVKKAFTVILLTSVTVWFFGNLNFSLGLCDPEESMLGIFCKAFSPVFSPLGFGFWQAALAILTGLGAKEASAGALLLLTQGEITNLFTPLSAVSFMAFMLLYTPCIPTLLCIKKETKSLLFMLSVAFFQFILAYFISFLVYLSGRVL